MALETATYINGLVATNPTAGDPVNQGDDHVRLLKSTILATFPNVTGAVTTTHTDLNGATKSHAASGYQKLAGGLYIQWGVVSYSGGSGSATFPIAFPNAVYVVTLGQLDSVAGPNPVISISGLTGFSIVDTDTSANSLCYIALGT